MTSHFPPSRPFTTIPDHVLLGHGGGGRLMHDLLDAVVLPALGTAPPGGRHDGALLPSDGSRLAFTTDTYVVRPLFFPGGDIGSLAVHGTVNDLAMCGARPVALSCSLLLEEGFPIDDLRRILASMRRAADDCGVPIVTGDTKVVDRGKGDGVFMNTSGIGVVRDRTEIAPGFVRHGDAILVSGDLGRHGVAILSAREGLAFETAVQSDSASVYEAVAALLDAEVPVRCLRDLTRGGLASALIELAGAARVAIDLDELSIPVIDPVRGACELLGLDPLYVACEGRFVAVVGDADSERALAVLRGTSVAREARRIGRVSHDPEARVTLRTGLGTSRRMEMFSGEQLPRIC